jgi:hypothetical protein
MKHLFCLLAVALLTQCAKTPPVTPSPTYSEREAAVLQTVAPLVAGQWRLTDVHYRRRPFFESPAGWPADTVVAQLATLTLAPAAPRFANTGHPTFEGELSYAGKRYPVYFALWANPDRVNRQQGPPAYFTLEYHFPDGTHQTAVEEQFLQDVGLVGGQFTLEATTGPATLHWQGLDRHLQSLTLRQ